MNRPLIRSFVREAVSGWNRFWFEPSHPAALAVIRMATGTLLFYSHVIWALHSGVFYGKDSWLNEAAVRSLNPRGAFSLLSLVDGEPAAVAAVHGLALTAAFCLAVGCCSRVAAMASFVLTVTFAHRNPAALYGFDQILGFLTLYLTVNPGHGWLSIDAWRAERRLNPADRRDSILQPAPSVTVATRLIQLHLCLLYLVAGTAKLKGAAWWSGVALWGAIGNQEYQTIDLTGLVHWPAVINLLTHVALAWEISYAFVVWNRWLRPVVLALAVAVHAGIGLCFGMLTFGLIMITANAAFIAPALFRNLTGTPDPSGRPMASAVDRDQPAVRRGGGPDGHLVSDATRQSTSRQPQTAR